MLRLFRKKPFVLLDLNRDQGLKWQKKTLSIDLQHPLCSDLTDKQKEQFFALMSEYSDVIAYGQDDLGRAKVSQHHIDTKDATPIQLQVRKVPLPGQEIIQSYCGSYCSYCTKQCWS